MLNSLNSPSMPRPRRRPHWQAKSLALQGDRRALRSTSCHVPKPKALNQPLSAFWTNGGGEPKAASRLQRSLRPRHEQCINLNRLDSLARLQIRPRPAQGNRSDPRCSQPTPQPQPSSLKVAQANSQLALRDASTSLRCSGGRSGGRSGGLAKIWQQSYISLLANSPLHVAMSEF